MIVGFVEFLHPCFEFETRLLAFFNVRIADLLKLAGFCGVFENLEPLALGMHLGLSINTTSDLNTTSDKTTWTDQATKDEHDAQLHSPLHPLPPK